MWWCGFLIFAMVSCSGGLSIYFLVLGWVALVGCKRLEGYGLWSYECLWQGPVARMFG